MKWALSGCKKGDIIRVRVNSVYHYGIFVDEQEVIQFGLPPMGVKREDNSDITVCVTDINGFSLGNIVERGVPSFKERLKKRSAEKTVEYARSKIGCGGYNLIHNNCEHFVNECVFGVRFSEQEELARKRWRERQILDVYISDIPDVAEYGKLYPEEREKEVFSVTNDKVKKEKYRAWQTLEYALNKTFYLDIKDVAFQKQKSGKWIADKCWFSVSHTLNAVVVAVSNKPVGVDIEELGEFNKKINNGYSDIYKFVKKICNEKEEKTFDGSLVSAATLWVKKESAFKAFGKGGFVPCKIDVAKGKFNIKNFNTEGGEYILSVCSENIDSVKYYTFK